MEQYMRRCIQLAGKALGFTAPNPLVGSVIVHNGVIIGEGYHRKAGEPHAEVNAINSVKNVELLKESTLYVNLEPCAHYGRTPPCSQLIIDKQIPRVVIGCVDSFSAVAGKGIEMMRSRGIEVVVGVCEEESRELNRRFFTFYEKRRPFVILKWAQSADGYIDAERSKDKAPVWLTNDRARTMVHKQRSEEGAILIGTNTALMDNPSLNVRMWHGRQPLRVIIDRNLKLKDLSMMSDSFPLMIINESKEGHEGSVEYAIAEFNSGFENNLLSVLYSRGIQSVVVEGGTATLQSFINHNLWDEAFVYHGLVMLNGGVKAPQFNASYSYIDDIDGVRLYYYRNE